MESKYQKVFEAAEKAGEIIVRYFDKALTVTEKSMAADFKTEADEKSEQIIIKYLTKYFPEYNIFGEENGLIDRGSEYSFVVDPLDGTNNFFLGIPDFSISIGLQQNNKTIFGLVYQPITKKLFWAEKGKGAWLGDTRLRVNQESDVTKLTIQYCCGYGMEDEPFRYSIQQKLHHQKIKRILQNWSVAANFSLMASGKMEAIIVNQIDLYDFVAGRLIAEEAGALISDYAGKPIFDDCEPVFLACNCKKTQKYLSSIIQKCLK